MKVVILAGGFGTRISEESQYKPKPMIEIGGKPILWHIMKIYSHYGFNDFIICAGYKQNVIKEYFSNYFLYNSDITFDFSNKDCVIVHNNISEPWKVTVVDTGLNTMTGGRVKRIQKYIGNEPFMLTYGDGVADVNINELVEFHKTHGGLATMTGVQPEGRFGVLELDKDGVIRSFREKSKEDSGWINGGFMVLEPAIFDFIAGDSIIFEKEPLDSIVKMNKLVCFQHHGFWQCMDTLRDKEKLDKMWSDAKAPWKLWK